MHRDRLQLTYTYSGEDRGVSLKALYRTDRNRDTHIALCRLLSQKKQPSTQDQKGVQRCELAAIVCMCIWWENTGQRDELRPDADLSNVHRQTERNLGSERNCQRTGAMPAQRRKRLAKSDACVLCTQGSSSLQLRMRAENKEDGPTVCVV